MNVHRLITRPEHISEEEPQYDRPSRRRLLRQWSSPVPQLQFRVRTDADELEDLILHNGTIIRGKDRCRAIGLGGSMTDCEQHRWKDSAYCLYHDKLRRGLTEPTVESYPVWPLPEKGYVLLTEAAAA